VKRLPPRLLVAAWDLVRSHMDRIFVPGAATALPGIDGWATLGVSGIELDREPVVSLLDALRAIALVQRSGSSSGSTERAELVCTLPSVDRNILATRDVTIDLLEHAEREILVMGFELTDRQLVHLLARRAASGVSVTLVGDRRSAWLQELRRAWPPVVPPPRALENVEPAEGDPRLMHAKAIVADRTTALIGSANFTAGGLRQNIEVGLRIRGSAASELVRTVDRLEREGWLVPARG
jgi:phosphatidylserine/phosphatidylglycerophosphate/cardiolipin synthase-like enzyme